MTHKTKVEFNGTKKGTVAANKLIVATEYFTKKEISQFEEDKYLEKIVIPEVEEGESKTSKPAQTEEVIKNIDEMSDEEITEYAEGLDIDTEGCEDINDVIDLLIAFDYSGLNKDPLKKHALILGVNLGGLTKKDEYAEALKTYLESLDTGDKE